MILDIGQRRRYFYLVVPDRHRDRHSGRYSNYSAPSPRQRYSYSYPTSTSDSVQGQDYDGESNARDRINIYGTLHVTGPETAHSRSIVASLRPGDFMRELVRDIYLSIYLSMEANHAEQK